MRSERKRRRKGLLVRVLVPAAAIWLVWQLCIDKPPVRECSPAEGETCRIFYLLNIDGMKGLGHSALLLIDENGAGKIFSYNGMQYNLFQCLLGKEGIGKMKCFSLDAEAVDMLLETGDLQAGNYEECDNFDRAVYRYITEEQYEAVIKGVSYYTEIGDEFERLYAEAYGGAEGTSTDGYRNLEVFLLRTDIPRYQIYTHNCDTVARELAAAADESMAAYNESRTKLTPNGNYKEMCRRLDDAWGFMTLGDDSLPERLLD